jgi:DNA-binding NtrC family response regulator
MPASTPPTATAGTLSASQAGAKLLIVDADTPAAQALASFFVADGHEVVTAASANDALHNLTEAANTFDCVLTELSLPDMSGQDFLRALSKQHRATAVIVTTAYGSVESAVESLRAGACDYLVKPYVDGELRQALDRALRERALRSENVALRGRLERKHNLNNIAGSDARMQKVFELVRAVASSRTTVLMTGESGTGKSLIAHAIHQHSPRSSKPFVEISCGSIPETLLESELFGHVKGAFTGAHADKVGRFLAANGGTIFLDEINSASPGMQLKLLRVLQERRFEAVGSSTTIEVDVRVILATNQPLEALVQSGAFRQDLYYRINVVNITLPPLRDRISDIPEMARFFLTKHAAELNRQIVDFEPSALLALQRYTFPGNVRELQNIVERAAVLTRGQVISLEDLPDHVIASPAQATIHALALTDASEDATPWTPQTLEAALREPERRIIRKALLANDWNRQKTSEQLGINRTTLYKKMKALGMLDDREDDQHQPRLAS